MFCLLVQFEFQIAGFSKLGLSSKNIKLFGSFLLCIPHRESSQRLKILIG